MNLGWKLPSISVRSFHAECHSGKQFAILGHRRKSEVFENLHFCQQYVFIEPTHYTYILATDSNPFLSIESLFH